MFKKYMSILALSALVSSAVAEECCCGDVKPEAKAEVMEAVCPCPEACMKAQDENCRKEDCCNAEMVKSQKIQGSKVQLKFNYNGRETAGEAYIPNNMDVKVSVDDVALISMTIFALDDNRVSVKASTLVMDKDTNEMVPQEEATHEAALGEAIHFEWQNLTMDITVLDVCDLAVESEQSAEQEAQPEAVQPEVAQPEVTSEPEQAAEVESESQAEEAPQAEQASQIESESVTEQAPEVEQAPEAVEQVA